MAQGLYEVIGHSIVSGNSGGPMRKLWLEKLPGMFADAKICRSQSVSKAHERGCPFWSRNKGPGMSPLRVKYDTTECAERGPAKTNVDSSTFPKRISFRALDP